MDYKEEDIEQVISFMLLRLKAIEELLLEKKVFTQKSLEKKIEKLYNEAQKDIEQAENEEVIDKKFLD